MTEKTTTKKNFFEYHNQPNAMQTNETLENI